MMEYVGYYLKSLLWRPIFEKYSRVMQKPVQHSDGYKKFELLWGKFKSAHLPCVGLVVILSAVIEIHGVIVSTWLYVLEFRNKKVY